jgi:hypothetical protein
MWSRVSEACWHMTQLSSGCRPCRFLRFAVQHRRRRASQRKNLTLGGARELQMSLAPKGVHEPMNIAP